MPLIYLKESGRFGDLEKVNQEKDLEFREDQMWYKIGEWPFPGLALSYHENGNFVPRQK